MRQKVRLRTTKKENLTHEEKLRQRANFTQK